MYRVVHPTRRSQRQTLFGPSPETFQLRLLHYVVDTLVVGRNHSLGAKFRRRLMKTSELIHYHISHCILAAHMEVQFHYQHHFHVPISIIDFRMNSITVLNV